MLSFQLFRAVASSWLFCVFRPSANCSFLCSAFSFYSTPPSKRRTTVRVPPKLFGGTHQFVPFIKTEYLSLQSSFSCRPPVFPTQKLFSSPHDNFTIENVPHEHGGSDSSTRSTSTNFAMDPNSDEARSITQSLGISKEQHEKLTELSHLVVEWNERLNLISRRDCTLDVVFGRHVLPSVALMALSDLKCFKEDATTDSDPDSSSSSSLLQPRIVDVGTGGGFPGLPLSIVLPNAEFLLVDSVGKKLKAVAEMAAELELENITTHHGRAEQIADDPAIGKRHRRKYDICVGRSVTAMPRFCFWIQDLLQRQSGKLIYIIGGEIEKNVQSRVLSDIPIDELLGCEGASDKKTLILSSSDVVSIAKESGEKKAKVSRRTNKSGNKNKKRQDDEGKWNNSKGNWKSRDNTSKKERGYSNFKRYEVD